MQASELFAIKKGNIQEVFNRNKIKDMQKESELFEGRLDKMRNFKRKMQKTKLKNGQISHDVTDWSNEIDDPINFFQDIKNNFQASLETLSLVHHQGTTEEE